MATTCQAGRRGTSDTASPLLPLFLLLPLHSPRAVPDQVTGSGGGVFAPRGEQSSITPTPGARPTDLTLGGRWLRHGRCWGMPCLSTTEFSPGVTLTCNVCRHFGTATARPALLVSYAQGQGCPRHPLKAQDRVTWPQRSRLPSVRPAQDKSLLNSFDWACLVSVAQSVP